MKQKTMKPSQQHRPSRRIKPARSERVEPQGPSLRFNPTAWAKLLYLRDLGSTEIGGFGVSSADDLLLIERFELVEQACTPVTVRFDDESVADYIDRQVDAGRSLERICRIWLHTHPDDCAAPSGLDEDTFDRVFGKTDWAVMFILARNGESYCRLRFNAGPGGSLEIPVEVDFGRPFEASDFDAWQQEYEENVRHIKPLQASRTLDLDDLSEFLELAAAGDDSFTGFPF